MTMQLASALGLRPLDRVQLADRQQIGEMRMSPQLGYGNLDLPFLFFQHATCDGRLALCSPGGYTTYADPSDVCDVIPGVPLVVRAMTEEGLLAHLRRPVSRRGEPPEPTWYAEAYVLHAQKDRWGRVDRVYLWYLDERLNGERPKYRPVHADDLAAVQASMRRTRMPVIGNGSSSYTADQGVQARDRLAAAAVSTFIEMAVRGHAAGASTLAGAGLASFTMGALNRMRTRHGEDAPPSQPGLFGP